MIAVATGKNFLRYIRKAREKYILYSFLMNDNSYQKTGKVLHLNINTTHFMLFSFFSTAFVNFASLSDWLI